MSQPLISTEEYRKMFQRFDEGIKLLIPGVEKAINEIWIYGWKYILLYVFIFAAEKILTGRIGSLLYNIFYFGILLLIIKFYGIGIIFNDWFEVIYALLHPITYFLTGRVLDRIWPRSRFKIYK